MSSETDRPLLSAFAGEFLFYAKVELGFAQQSLIKYQDCLRQVIRMLGDRPLGSYTRNDLLSLKASMLSRGNSVSRQVSILAALKRLLRFATDQRGLSVLDPSSVLIPRRPRREVIFLSTAEVERFVTAIALTTRRGRPCPNGIRFRALVETLLGSAMRIGELLSLDRDQVDFANREARIVGKGNKERTVFFTARALEWLSKYLRLRTDAHPAMFVCQDGQSRLKQVDIWRPFARIRHLAGINKPVRPHMLRHTAATQLLFNGCPIGHIKEILGHDRLETTCRYYLGLDHSAAKLAHHRYLLYDGHNQDSAAT
jgi:integrase/recombinase XerD